MSDKISTTSLRQAVAPTSAVHAQVSQSLFSQQPVPPPQLELEDSARLLSLLLALHSDLERIGLKASLAANIANALVAGQASPQRASMMSFFDKDMASYTLCCLRLRRQYSGLELCTCLEALNADLHRLANTIVGYAAADHEAAPELPELTERLSVDFRTLCNSVRKALISGNQLLAEHRIAGAREEARELHLLLEDSARGQFGLLDAAGYLVMPSWAEQREYTRVVVRSDVAVICGDQQQDSVLRDISVTGLGVDGVSGLQLDDRVTIAIEGLRTFDGTVIWAHRDRAGVRLSRRLHADDPTLEFLNAKVARALS